MSPRQRCRPYGDVYVGSSPCQREARSASARDGERATALYVASDLIAPPPPKSGAMASDGEATVPSSGEESDGAGFLAGAAIAPAGTRKAERRAAKRARAASMSLRKEEAKGRSGEGEASAADLPRRRAALPGPAATPAGAAAAPQRAPHSQRAVATPAGAAAAAAPPPRKRPRGEEGRAGAGSAAAAAAEAREGEGVANDSAARNPPWTAEEEEALWRLISRHAHHGNPGSAAFYHRASSKCMENKDFWGRVAVVLGTGRSDVAVYGWAVRLRKDRATSL